MTGVNSLWDAIGRSGAATRGLAAPAAILGRKSSFTIADLAVGSTLGPSLETLRGRAVLLSTREQLATAVALIELDGVARRMVLCTPDLTPQQLLSIAAAAEADCIVSDTAPGATSPLTPFVLAGRPQPAPSGLERRASEHTEWILLTSGTTGAPKLVAHTLETLAGTLPAQPRDAKPSTWSTFYDIRRYGGLQIYLRAVLGRAPLVLSSSAESTHDFLARAAAAGVTHISGTPSHWRRALMSGEARILKPEYVRLSGEVADQALLDSLGAAYPNALVAHAFASTEAGLAFEVNDGLAGFPADFLGAHPQIEMKIVDGTLRVRSGRTALRYIGSAGGDLAGGDRFVDTGDRVELVDQRYYFRGRMGGVINVGGLKVYPEEVESVLNADPRVRMSLVRARRSPITGAVAVADVVLADGVAADGSVALNTLKTDLLDACRRALPAHKVPATLRFVRALELTTAGKLVRPSDAPS